MKKAKRKATDELRPEYRRSDFGELVRGKYAARYRERLRVVRLDTTDYFDFAKANRVDIEFDPGVEAPVKSISIRLPREMLNELKVLANKKDIPYQSLIKVYLAEKIAEERRAS